MNKTRSIFIMLLFLISGAVYAQSKVVKPMAKGFNLAYATREAPLNCKQYRYGTFQIRHDGKVITIKRYGDTQAEYINNSKKPIVYKIKWKNACTCILTPTKETLAQHYPDITKKTILTVQIFHQNTNSFSQLTSAPYATAKTVSEMYKIGN